MCDAVLQRAPRRVSECKENHSWQWESGHFFANPNPEPASIRSDLSSILTSPFPWQHSSSISPACFIFLSHPLPGEQQGCSILIYLLSSTISIGWSFWVACCPSPPTPVALLHHGGLRCPGGLEVEVTSTSHAAPKASPPPAAQNEL